MIGHTQRRCGDQSNARIRGSRTTHIAPPTQSEQHCIILIQPTKSTATRTFSDHANVQDAIESAPCVCTRLLHARSALTAPCAGVCELFERKLSELNPHIAKITYDVADLYNYIDKLVRGQGSWSAGLGVGVEGHAPSRGIAATHTCCRSPIAPLTRVFAAQTDLSALV